MSLNRRLLDHLIAHKFYSHRLRQQVENAVSKGASSAYHYALYILQGPFPLGESAIATSSWYAYGYAYYILGRPFELGELSIVKNRDASTAYLTRVLHKPLTDIHAWISQIQNSQA